MTVDLKMRARFDLLDKSGYLAGFWKMAMNMTAPLWWTVKNAEGPEEIRNGTICLIRAPGAVLGVTADHVFNQYLVDRQAGVVVSCQIAGATWEPRDYLVDRSAGAELDVAVFRLPEFIVWSSPDIYPHEPLVWHPPPVLPGDVLLYGGYPQALRGEGDATVDFRFQSFATRVGDVSSSRIVLNPAPSNLYWPGHDGEAINEDWGGQSGGPVYRVIDANPPHELIDRLELVGVITDKVFGQIVAVPITCVHHDGTILH